MLGVYSGRRLMLLVIFVIIIAVISGISTYAFVKYLG